MSQMSQVREFPPTEMYDRSIQKLPFLGGAEARAWPDDCEIASNNDLALNSLQLIAAIA